MKGELLNSTACKFHLIFCIETIELEIEGKIMKGRRKDKLAWLMMQSSSLLRQLTPTGNQSHHFFAHPQGKKG